MDYGTEEFVRECWSAALKPEPLLTVSEWADEHRELPKKSSAESGRWRTARTPYLREIMDCLSTSSPIERVVFMKGAQIGGSEAGNNFLGYLMHHAPGPALMVQPTVDTAKRYSKGRIGPMIGHTEVLCDLISEPRSRDSGNTLFQKDYPGGSLVMTGANSAVGLRSMPIRYLFLDEVDGYPDDADGEGDPVDLAIKRTSTYVRRKIFMASTPKFKDFSRIEQAYRESDQRRYLVPCRFCGVFGEIIWAQIKWDDDPSQAQYECHACKERHPEHLKEALLAGGKWKAQAEGDGNTAGFHLSALYSPWATWGETAEAFIKAKPDPSRLQVWVNTALGETWEDQGGEQLELDVMMSRKEEFKPWLAPDVCALTCGVDVQDYGLEYEVVAWGPEEESWSLEYEVIHGDPSSPKTWNKLDDLRRKRYPHSRQIDDMRIEAMAIDMGGHYSDQVLEFAYARRSAPVWAIKGHTDPLAPIWPAQFSKSNKARRPLYMLGVHRAKDVIAARMRIEEPGPGYCHIPDGRDEIWFEQFTNEIVKTKYRHGRPVRYWTPKRDGDRVEAFDCRGYAYAALKGLERQKRLKLADRVTLVQARPMKSQLSGVDEDQRPKPAPRRQRPQRTKSSYMSR